MRPGADRRSVDEQFPLAGGEILDGEVVVIGNVSGLARRIAAHAPDVVLIDIDNPTRDVLEELTLASGPLERPVAMFVSGAKSGLSRNFREASLVGNYTDFKLEVASGAEYRIDASATYAGIVYPREMTVTYELEKGSNHELRGHQGGENAEAVINARLSYGGLKVRND